MKNTLMSVIVLSTISTASHALCNANGCYNVNIQKILVRNNGSILVETSGDESLLNCTSPANRYISLLSDAGQKSIYAMLLTKQTSGKTISIRITPASSGCSIAYVY